MQQASRVLRAIDRGIIYSDLVRCVPLSRLIRSLVLIFGHSVGAHFYLNILVGAGRCGEIACFLMLRFQVAVGGFEPLDQFQVFAGRNHCRKTGRTKTAE